MMMYRNIICFFSFPFITWNVCMSWVREGQRWLSLHTHMSWLYRSVNPFLFVLLGSKSSLVCIIFQTLTQVLMVTPLAYTLHVDIPPSSMPPTQLMQHIKGIFQSISNNICSFYFFTKQIFFNIFTVDHSFNSVPNYLCPVGLGCRIHWLLLCRGVRPRPSHNECLGYDTKQSDGEVLAVPLHCHRSQVHSAPEW